MKKEIILSGNCFWCFEAIFQKVKGVGKVESGYYNLKDYDFKFKQDDKIEVVKIEYDDEIISLNLILDIFYLSHTPTINIWKKEECFSYMHRSAIVVSNNEDESFAEQKIKELNDAKTFDGEVSTKIIKLIPGAFSLAKEEDRDFFNKNPKDGYCLSQIIPKFEKIGNKFPQYFHQ